MADSAPYKPSQWAVGKATAQFGDAATLTIGETTSAVLGWQFAFTVGGNTSVFVDPFVCLRDITPNFLLSIFNSPLSLALNPFLGRTQFYLSHNNGYRLGDEYKIGCSSETTWTPSKASLPFVATFFKMMGLSTLVGVAVFGFAGDKVVKHWESADTTGKASVCIATTLVVTFVVLLALVVTWLVEENKQEVAKQKKLAEARNALTALSQSIVPVAEANVASSIVANH